MNSAEYFGPLMDDFYAESEEHLVALRRALLFLEENDRSTPLADEQVRSILRSLHTLKGLAGMVGFGEAEGLVHALEDWMRVAAPAGSVSAELTLEPLFAGATLFEQALEARRAAEGTVEVAAFIKGLTSPLKDEAKPSGAAASTGGSTAGGAKLSEVEQYRLDAALERGAAIFSFEFAPAAELSARGVGVEAVRGRLGGIGEIIQAAPRVLPGRGVAFNFLVALSRDEEPPATWSDDGMTWEVVPASQLAPQVAPQRDERALPKSPAAELPSGERTGSGAGVVRVELGRLDELMRLLGELVLSRAKLNDLVERASFSRAPVDLDTLEELNTAMERQIRDLRDGVMRIRLVQIGEVFERMRFVVRDVAREAGKRVRVELEGQDTEIDKLLVERMMEPMLHLVRNAVSHGIEAPAAREAAGKPPQGEVRLSASTVGERIRIEIADDGAGVNRAAVAARAHAAGLNLPAGELDDSALLDILCAPGFSTASEADLASGRGIGMDVVRSTVLALGGELTLQSEPGAGSRFTIELPLTLMIVDALLVRLGTQVMAVPQPALLEILQVADAEIVPFENNEVIRYRDGVLPVLRLRRLFGMAAGEHRPFLTILVVGTAGQPVGIAVDSPVGLREIVVRSMPDPLVAVPGISGATELGDGTLCLILDSAELIQLAQDQRAGGQRRTSTARLT